MLQPNKVKILCIATAILLLHCIPVANRPGDRLTKKWVEDKYGCLKFRNKQLADSLIGAHGLMSKSKQAFLDVFQSPDSISNTNSATILTYYFDNACENGKPIPGVDKCYINFYFIENKLTTVDAVCE